MVVRSTAPIVRKAAAATAALALCGSAFAGVTPTFNSGGVQGTHNAGAGSPFVNPITLNNGTAVLGSPWNAHTTTFAGGSTKAKAGVGRTQSSTVAKVTFASGTGVDQTDPNHTQPASSMKIEFSATWDIIGGTFGPSMAGTFSMPFGAKVLAGGSASVSINVHWNAIVNNNLMNDVRAPYITSASYNSPGNYLTTFNAPASPFSPSSISDNAGKEDQIILTGVIEFTANNEDQPVLAGFPSMLDYTPTSQEEQAILQLEPNMAVEEVVPEPSSIAVLGAGSLLLLRRTRRSNPSMKGESRGFTRIDRVDRCSAA